MPKRKLPNLYELGIEPEDVLRVNDIVNIRAYEENQRQKVVFDSRIEVKNPLLLPSVFNVLSELFPQVLKVDSVEPIVYPYSV